MTTDVFLFGTAESFHYHRVGGTDSFLRRLIDEIATRPNTTISGVFYGADTLETVRPHDGVELRYVRSFEEALAVLDERSAVEVVTTRLNPRERLLFARYRRRNPDKTYHSIEFFYLDSWLLRNVKFAQHRVLPYDGTVFCVSRRLYSVVSRFTDDAVYLPPPIDTGYFRNPAEKPDDETIRLTFIGRIDPRKGINEVIDLYDALDDRDRFDFAIHGTYIENDDAGVEIRNRLRDDPDIEYTEVDRHSHTAAVDQQVQSRMRETDVFLQPYRTLDSTVDTPLLLLESMASLCAVLTRPVGNVGDLYGESEFLVTGDDVTDHAIELLESIDRETLQREQKRIHERASSMGVDTPSVVNEFLDNL